MPAYRVERSENGGQLPRRGRPSPAPHEEGLATSQLLALQRAAGNTAVGELIAGSGAITIQRDRGHAAAAAPAATTALDDRAHAIINAAQADHPAIAERAVSTVRQIINTYYADRASTVSDITYDSSEPGLMTTSVGRGASSTGSIAVGEYFVTNTTAAEFARRVLQVGHELEHIQQYRSGLGGGGHRHEREFLAFSHEGTATAVAHTGRMAHATRVRLIDEAIRHYNAFSAADKERYAEQYRDLLAERTREQRASGRDATSPPTEAAR